MIPVLTIDGPSGSGKGTISQLVSQRLGWHFLDSGAVYRALALLIIEQKIDITQEDLIVEVANDLKIQFVLSNHDYQVLLYGRDVSSAIRAKECSLMASKVAVSPKIRNALLGLQRDFRQSPGLVADGRDMGTIVFPDAVVKVFLDASLLERVQRRYKQLQEKQISVSLDEIYRELVERDKRDSERAFAPLKSAYDANLIDTTAMNIEQVVAMVSGLVLKKLAIT